jgi:hypothetical protein
MGVPTSEVGYTSATTGRETTKSMTDMWWHWIKNNTLGGGSNLKYPGFKAHAPYYVIHGLSGFTTLLPLCLTNGIIFGRSCRTQHVFDF